jgi:tetratricopeptide (TPR) repeat protein
VGRHLGLIIGVNTYQDATFRPLRCAETDAKALAQWLVHARGGKWSPADVQVMSGTEVTRELVGTLTSHLCLNIATSEDLILIYFAGYAYIDPVNGESYLACNDTHYQQSGSGFPLQSLINQMMARSPAAQILCILDCVQIGPIWNTRRSSPFDYKPLFGPTLQNSLQQMQGRLFYCTCRGTEIAPEVVEKNLGSFMYRMIMGVGGPAIDPTTGQITLQHLHAFLAEKLSEQQRPQVFGQEQRPLVLVGELPSFKKSGALNSAIPGSPLSSTNPSGQLAGTPMPAMASAVAQLDPSASGLGRNTEQSRQQQCQQLLQQARQLVQVPNLQQAYQVVETILQINPQFVEALILKGQILGTTGQFQEALTTVKQVVQVDPNNALGWSMAAALLTNTGQLQEGMSAADRSLSLDPTNSETLSIKETIRERLAEMDVDTGKRSRLQAPQKKSRGGPKSVALALAIQVVALLIGTLGAFLLLFKPGLPISVGFALESIGLALLIVNATRGAYLYGVSRVAITLFFSVVTLGSLGAIYKVRAIYDLLLRHVGASFSLLTPLIFLVGWLVAAALLPFLLSLVGWLVGAIVGLRRRQSQS